MKEINHLQEQLELQRQSLRDVNDTLKRLSGRSKTNNEDENRSWRESFKGDVRTSSKVVARSGQLGDTFNNKNGGGGGNGRSYTNDSRRGNDEDRTLKRKASDDDYYRHGQKRTTTEQRASVASSHHHSQHHHHPHHHPHHHQDLDDDPKPMIKSSVSSISKKDIKTREDLIKLQTKFNGSEQRNRRMIGLLVGTLRDFKSDDKERSSTKQALDRRELEKKIEVKKIEEEKRIAEEKKRLEQERARNLRNIKIIEKKIELTESFANWKKNQMPLRNFIRTKTQPAIFYLPRTHNSQSQALLEASAQNIDQQIQAKKIEIERELDALTQESEALMSQSQAEETAKTTSAAQLQSTEKSPQELEPKPGDVTEEAKEEAEAEEALDQEPDDVELVDEEMVDDSAAPAAVAIVTTSETAAVATADQQPQEEQEVEK